LLPPAYPAQVDNPSSLVRKVGRLRDQEKRKRKKKKSFGTTLAEVEAAKETIKIHTSMTICLLI
jgi:hypothetical protein